MAYTKNYYHILQLPAPGWTSKQQITPAELRRAYKLALLAAHPDKVSAVAATTATTNATKTKTKPAYTVDDVKEAYTTLANATSKSEYDNWFLRHGDGLITTTAGKERGSERSEVQLSSDFVLGLELLDLGDFEMWEGGDVDTAISTGMASPGQREEEGVGGGAGGEGQTTWTRGCRCGADRGFSILEEELEDAEERGEKEVLVGCVGCSLWVRVGFEVEVG